MMMSTGGMDNSQMMMGSQMGVSQMGGPQMGGYGMGDMSGGGMMQFSRLQLNPMEQPFYQNLFGIVDPHGMGFVDGATAANFLQKSGLARPILHEIWRLADSYNAGQLDVEGFFVACRLVAHAQNGLPVTQEAIMQEPPSLPMFDVTRAPSEHSVHDSVQGFGSFPGGGPLGTMMDPNMAAAAMMGAGADGTGTPPMMSPCSIAAQQQMFRSTGSMPGGELGKTGTVWALNESDRQNYVGAFNGADSNGDGFVEGMEARMLLSTSGLQDNDLMQIWNLADQDGDGRLSLNEFAVLMHLVNRRTRGSPIPPTLPEELVMVLTNGLMNLQLPPATPPGPSSSPPTPTGGDEGGRPSTAEDEASDRKEKKKERRKKEKRGKSSRGRDGEEGRDEEPSFGDLVRDEAEKEKDRVRGGKESLSPRRQRTSDNLSREEEGSDSRSRLDTRHRTRDVETWRESPATLIESVIEADKQISKTLAQEVDNHDLDLRRLNEVSGALKQEIVREKTELQRQLERKRDFERQAEDVRLDLEKLKEERRKLDLERISMNRDISHYQDETLFLKQQVEDMQKDIQMLTESNQMLDKTYRQTEGQIKALDMARRNVLDSLKDEREVLRKEEREIAELKSALERMRREKDDAQSKQCVLQERLRQADQDRTLLVSSLETERSKLAAIRSQRIDLSEQKQGAFKEMTALAQQEWMQTNVPAFGSSPGFSSVRGTKPIDMISGVPTSGSSGRPGFGQLRDAKGIPAGAPSISSVPSDAPYQSTGSIPVRNDTFLSGGSSATPSHWTMFGSTPPGGSTRIRGPMERRGVDGILALDSNSAWSGQFNSNKPDHLGSRRTDVEFGSRRTFDRDVGYRSARRADESDGEAASKRSPRRTGASSDEGESDRGRRQSRSPSGGKLSARKHRDTELEVKFSDSLDLDSKSKGNNSRVSSKTDRKGKASKRSIPTEAEIRSAGLETPSFGARSLNQSNSVVSH